MGKIILLATGRLTSVPSEENRDRFILGWIKLSMGTSAQSNRNN